MIQTLILDVEHAVSIGTPDQRAAMEEAIPVYVLSAALYARYRSRVEHTFGDKLLSAMRFGFGGHVEIPQ